MRTHLSIGEITKLFNLVAVTISLLCTAGCLSCGAQEKPPSAASVPNAGKAPEQTPESSPCDVQERNDITPTTPYIGSISDDVTLVVQDLDACLKKEKILASDLRVAPDGVLLPKLHPTPGPAGQNYVKFTLRIDPYDRDDRTRWARIIRSMRQANNGVTLTLANGKTGELFP